MNSDHFLSSDSVTSRVASVAALAVGQSGKECGCHLYLSALDSALAKEQPFFDTMRYADIYRAASEGWEWMAVSLITNAEREGDGAKRLWSLSACCCDPQIQQLLKQHAVDESRHALLYLALLDLTFPGRVDPAFRDQLNQLSPHYATHHKLFVVEGSPYAKNPTIDDFLQMNVAEIRTAIHHAMQRPAVANHCPPNNRRRIELIQDSLLRDEIKHVAYTALLIENIATSLPADRLSNLFRKRMHDFNQITLDELGQGAFDCSVRCCATHSHCRPVKEAVSGDLVNVLSVH